MKQLPEKNVDTAHGLHRRYIVAKADGSPVDPEAVYFVLRIDAKGDDILHLLACQDAALEFCKRTPNARLGRELRQLVAHYRGMLAARQVAEELTP